MEEIKIQGGTAILNEWESNSTSTSKDDIKVSIWEKMAYGSGDVSCSISFAVINSLLTLFYTDYVGIPIATVGLVMLLSRIFDGGSDLVMGFLTENVKSKHGKARPWILWMSVPYLVAMIALFCVPANATETLKFIYIFVTYNLLTTVIFTALNLPYGVLGSLMTRNQHERGIIAIFRMGMAPFGKIIAVSFTLPMVEYFGNDQKAFVTTISIWSVVGFFLLLACFFGCKERVEVNREKQEKINLKIALKSLFQNKYWIYCLVLWALMNIHGTVVGISLPYYTKYILSGNHSYMYSLLYTTEFVVLAVGAFLCTGLLKKVTKRDMALAGSILVIIAQAALFLNPTNFYWALATSAIRSLGQAPLFAVVFGMLADTVEYGQWKTHTRYEGLIYSSASLGSKVGPGIASAITSLILSLAGYISSTQANTIQPESAKIAILELYKWGPIGVWVCIAIVLFFYKLDKIYPTIMKELSQREAKGEL